MQPAPGPLAGVQVLEKHVECNMYGAGIASHIDTPTCFCPQKSPEASEEVPSQSLKTKGRFQFPNPGKCLPITLREPKCFLPLLSTGVLWGL